MAKSPLRDRPNRASFSAGTDRLLECVRPYGRPETAFPEGLDVADTRRVSGESLREWFVRLVDKYCGGDPRQVGIEENIAILAKLKWEEGRLIYASVPVLVADRTLDEYCIEDRVGAVFFRLDLNYETLGEAFSHPLVHIHMEEEGSPRFSLDGGTNGNVVMDFLEFVYRNYQPKKWIEWARGTWLRKRGDEARSVQFDRIVKAFREAQFNVLRDEAHAISQIKRVLRGAKDSLFKDHMNGADREILEYPQAR
jgi:hypothetical protein